jgi:hypothetical protein
MTSMTKKYVHIVRANGTIRLAGPKSDGMKPGEGEIAVEADQIRTPGLWFYDFSLRKLVPYSEASLEARRRDGVAAGKAASEAREAKVARVRRLAAGHSPEMEEMVDLLLDMLGAGGAKKKKGKAGRRRQRKTPDA